MSVPLSTIYIMGHLPIDNRYEHSLYFPNESAQVEYFQTKRLTTYQKYTYLRKNWTIKVEATMSFASMFGYLGFQNGANGKWYYYFINKVEYVNDSTVELFLEMDVIQTYLFDMNFKDCFIERTHTLSDDIGEHTLDEGLEMGMLTNAKTVDISDLTDMCILVLSAVTSEYQTAWAEVYDGVFSGLRVYAVELEDYTDFGEYLDHLSANGTIDAIVGIWMYPKNLVRMSTGEQIIHNVTGARSWAINMDGLNDVKADLFEGYEPKNNKLYSYPFNFLYCSNNSGGSAVYRYERFTGADSYTFSCFGAMAPDANVKIAPKNYNGILTNYEEGFSLGAFPSCAWDSDTYKVWLAQNPNTHALAMTQAKIQAGAGALTALASVPMGNMTGAVGGLAMGWNALNNVQSLMAQKADMEIQPPQARGNHSATVNVANDKQTFSFYYKCLTKEYARSIDEYLTRYGYKVNRIGKPILKARNHFTYIKTSGCVVSGYEIQCEDQKQIGAIFDKGITFWVDPKEVGDYTVNNAV